MFPFRFHSRRSKTNSYALCDSGEPTVTGLRPLDLRGIAYLETYHFFRILTSRQLKSMTSEFAFQTSTTPENIASALRAIDGENTVLL